MRNSFAKISQAIEATTPYVTTRLLFIVSGLAGSGMASSGSTDAGHEKASRCLKWKIALSWQIVLLAIIFSLPAAATTAPDRPARQWREGSLSVSTQSEFFSTNANYSDSRTSYERLASDSNLSSLETRAKVRYGWSRSIAVFSGLGLNYIRALDPVQDKTNSAFTDVSFGANFQLPWQEPWQKWFRLVPEFEISLPFDKTQTGQTVPMTNDGVAYVRTGTFLFKRINRFNLDAYLGMHYPLEELATRIFYNASFEMQLKKGFTLGSGLAGYESVLSDKSTYTKRLPTYSSASAGSQRFWAYNPALLEMRGWVGFLPTKDFAFRLAYTRTLNGIRTAAGQSVILSAVINFPEFNRTRIDSGAAAEARARRPHEKSLENFEETKPTSPTNEDFEADDTAVDVNELDAAERQLDNRQ
jgi:hypothetical protein